MIIDLPKYETIGITVMNEHMKIENGILKIQFPYSLRKAMYALTYKMKGKHKCFYCGCEISNGKATLDHLFPQYLGGPTITDNLVPSCMECNTKKSNMTQNQFKFFLSVSTKARKKYLNDLQENFEVIRKSGDFVLPKNWLEEKEVHLISTNSSFSKDCDYNKYRNIQEYYKRYGQFQEPLIIDKNNFLLDGFYILMYAKNHNIQKVPVITLENVEVIF